MGCVVKNKSRPCVLQSNYGYHFYSLRYDVTGTRTQSSGSNDECLNPPIQERATILYVYNWITSVPYSTITV